MTIIHIANIDSAIIGGVQKAVPQMVMAQSKYANAVLVNTHGDILNNVQMLEYSDNLDVDAFLSPFNHPDLVVFHELYRFEYIKICHSLIDRNIPYIIIPHGCLSKTAQSKKRIKKFFGNLLFFNKFIKSAKAIQYLSDNEKKTSAYPKYNSFVSGNGISLPDEKKETFFESGIKFVYIGRLEIQIKGLDLLLEGIKKCENLLRQKRATIEIYGPDDLGSHKVLKDYVEKLRISDLVKINKEITGSHKIKKLLSADCFIQTSRTEGLPLGPIEAMGYGLPCIVTDGVGLGDIIESYGAGYRCNTSSNSIANVIEQFINNLSEIGSMSMAAVKLSKEKFNLDSIAKNTVDKYDDLLKNVDGRD